MPRRIEFPGLTLREQPVSLPALAFVLGLLVASFTQISLWLSLAISAVLWSIFPLIASRRSVATLTLMTAFLVAGATFGILDQTEHRANVVRRLIDQHTINPGDRIEVIGKISPAPELAPNRIYLPIEITSLHTSTGEWKASARIRVVVLLGDEASRRSYDELALHYSDHVRIFGSLRSGAAFRNPGVPDFTEILRSQGYDAIGLVRNPDDIQILARGSRSGIFALLYRMRARAIRNVLEGTSQPGAGLLVASLFGNRHFIDRRLGEGFREGGTFHLIVISGMHIALLAGTLLAIFRRIIAHLVVRYATVIAVVWCYTVMAGAEPAVTRAAVMITFVLAGRAAYRDTSGTNSLASAGITLLLWRPHDIYNSSFQLSFLTVAVMTLVTGPVYSRLKEIGQWRPSERTPYPPVVCSMLGALAESLFWDERNAQKGTRQARVRFRLQKASSATALSRLRAQWLAIFIFATLFVTTGVQLGLLPLMIVYFHRVSLVSPIANILEGVLLSGAMIAGCIYLVIAGVFTPAGRIAAIAVDFTGSLLTSTVSWLGETFPPAVRIPSLQGWLALLYPIYLLLFVVLAVMTSRWNPLARKMERSRRRNVIAGWIVFLSWLLTLILFVVHPFERRFDRNRLRLTFLDVGQGDSTFVSFPRGTTMLIDAGGRPDFSFSTRDADYFQEDRPGVGEMAVAPFLWQAGVSRIDYIIATHGDADHTQGFGDIAAGFSIRRAVSADPRIQTDPYPAQINARRIPRITIKKGDRLEMDGVELEVLSPSGDSASAGLSDNNRSLVLRMVFGRRSFLFTGDIERKTEEQLVLAREVRHTDVLKVAHHGSRTSSSQSFLSSVLPCFAVISVSSPSPYGHPHPEVVQRLENTGARILRTSECGAVTFSTDGSDLKVETFVPCESSLNRR
jgi:competence protein ComEC